MNQEINYNENITQSVDVEKELIRGVTYEWILGVTYDQLEEPLPLIKKPQNEDIHLNVKSKVVNLRQSDNQFKCMQQITEKSIQNEVMVTDGVIIASSLNFELQLLRMLVRVYDTADGERTECSYQIRVTVFLQNGGVREFIEVVPSNRVRSNDWLQMATHSLANIPKKKTEIEEFQAKVQRCLETEDVPCEYIYQSPGWRNTPQYGWRFVHYQGMVGENTPLVHTARATGRLEYDENKVGNKDVFFAALSAMDICNSGKASTSLFLFTHAALLETLFEIADIPIRFVYGIAGVTNSRKTSLALAISKIFDRKTLVADAEFTTATACGIEKVLSLYKDGVVIIDDFKPGVNYAQQKLMDAKLDGLIRFYGNRVAKVRMTEFNKDAEKLHFPIQGACVLTMEIVTGVLSSVSRMYIAEITSRDVDNSKLSFFQNNKSILPTHYYDFIKWVTGNFQDVVKKLSYLHNRYRSEYHFEVQRYNESIAVLLTTANIIADYAIERGFWNCNDKDVFMRNVEGILISEITEMQTRFRRRDKAYLIVDALMHSIYQQKVVPITLTNQSSMERYDIYEDKDFIFVRSSYLRKIVNDFAHEYGEGSVVLNKEELIGLLERVNVLSIIERESKREASRKLPVQSGNTLRYLFLDKKRMQEILSE